MPHSTEASSTTPAQSYLSYRLEKQNHYRAASPTPSLTSADGESYTVVTHGEVSPSRRPSPAAPPAPITKIPLRDNWDRLLRILIDLRKRALANEAELATLRQQQEREDEGQRQDDTPDAKEDEIKSLRLHIEAQDAETESLRDGIEAYYQEICTLRAEKDELLVNNAEAKSKEHDRLSGLCNALVTLNSELTEAKTRETESSALVEEHEATIKERDVKIQRLESEVKLKVFWKKRSIEKQSDMDLMATYLPTTLLKKLNVHGHLVRRPTSYVDPFTHERCERMPKKKKSGDDASENHSDPDEQA